MIRRSALAWLAALAVAGGFATVATRADYSGPALPSAVTGAPADTKRVQVFGVTATIGSPNITMATAPASSYVGANIVVAGLGPSVAQGASVSAAGSGYVYGERLTLNAGCVTNPVLRVASPLPGAAAGAVVVAVPVTPGSCAAGSLPGNPVSVLSTTGAGVGATFTITWAAAPLQTTISAVNGTAVTLAANAQQTLSAASEWAAWGHDDAPAINAALASGATTIRFPTATTFGIYSPLVAPTGNRVDLICDGATIVALAPIAQMLSAPKTSNFFGTEGSVVDRCRFDGMGVAQQNVNHQQFTWSYRNNVFMNATLGNVYVGGATGYGENSVFSGNDYRNDTSVVGTYPQYNVSVNYTDNHFTDEIGSGAVNNFMDTSAGTHLTNVHGYYSLDSQFLLAGASTAATRLLADNAPDHLPGIELTGTSIGVVGWTATALASNGQIGVWVSNRTGSSVVIGGRTNANITSANMVGVAWAPYQSAALVAENNLQASYTNAGAGDGTVCFGLGNGCGAASVGLGPYSNTNYGGIAIGISNNAYTSGAISMGSGAADNGASHFAYSPNNTNGVGAQQAEIGLLYGAPAAASPARMTTNGAAASSSNSLNLPAAASAVGYDRIAVTCFDYVNTKAALFYVDGLLIRRGSTAASTTIVGTPTITLAQADASLTSAGLTAGSLAVTADVTNGGPNFTITAPTGIALRVVSASVNAMTK